MWSCSARGLLSVWCGEMIFLKNFNHCPLYLFCSPWVGIHTWTKMILHSCWFGDIFHHRLLMKLTQPRAHLLVSKFVGKTVHQCYPIFEGLAQYLKAHPIFEGLTQYLKGYRWLPDVDLWDGKKQMPIVGRCGHAGLFIFICRSFHQSSLSSFLCHCHHRDHHRENIEVYFGSVFKDKVSSFVSHFFLPRKVRLLCDQTESMKRMFCKYWIPFCTQIILSATKFLALTLEAQRNVDPATCFDKQWGSFNLNCTRCRHY